MVIINILFLLQLIKMTLYHKCHAVVMVTLKNVFSSCCRGKILRKRYLINHQTKGFGWDNFIKTILTPHKKNKNINKMEIMIM